MQARTAKQGLLIWVADQRYVLALSDIQRLLPYARLTPLPAMPATMLGILDLHGTQVPVIDLQALLGGPATGHALNTRLALLIPASGSLSKTPDCALAVRSSGGVTRLASAPEVQGEDPAIPHALSTCGIQAISRDDKGPLPWIDVADLRRRALNSLLQLASTAGTPTATAIHA